MTLPNGVEEINEKAFYGCSGLETVVLSSSLKQIGNDAFSMCSSLKSITVPSGVTSIRQNAFAGCTALDTVTFASPEGWCIKSKPAATDGRAIDVSNPKNNADFLTIRYFGSVWYRA